MPIPLILNTFPALVCFSEEVRSRCHVKHTLPRWPAESNNIEASEPNANATSQPGQNVRRQKSYDMLDQSAIQYARQHKVQSHQVGKCTKLKRLPYFSSIFLYFSFYTNNFTISYFFTSKYLY